MLVAVGVWLIPIVLDGPGEDAPASAPVAELDLSSGEAEPPIRTETVELEAPPARNAAAANDAAGGGATPPAAGAVSSASADTNSTAAEASPATDGAAESPAAAAAATAATQPEPTPAEPTPAEPPPAEPAAPSRPAPGWGVQIGAFSELANAEQQARRIRDLGYDAFVAPVESGGRTLHRVRVGGFATETQAEVASSALAAHDFPGDVYGPE